MNTYCERNPFLGWTSYIVKTTLLHNGAASKRRSSLYQSDEKHFRNSTTNANSDQEQSNVFDQLRKIDHGPIVQLEFSVPLADTFRKQQS